MTTKEGQSLLIIQNVWPGYLVGITYVLFFFKKKHCFFCGQFEKALRIVILSSSTSHFFSKCKFRKYFRKLCTFFFSNIYWKVFFVIFENSVKFRRFFGFFLFRNNCNVRWTQYKLRFHFESCLFFVFNPWFK